MPKNKTSTKPNKLGLNFNLHFVLGFTLGAALTLVATIVYWSFFSASPIPPTNGGWFGDVDTCSIECSRFYDGGHFHECYVKCLPCDNKCVNEQRACESKCAPGLNDCSKDCQHKYDKCSYPCYHPLD